MQSAAGFINVKQARLLVTMTQVEEKNISIKTTGFGLQCLLGMLFATDLWLKIGTLLFTKISIRGHDFILPLFFLDFKQSQYMWVTNWNDLATKYYRQNIYKHWKAFVYFYVLLSALFRGQLWNRCPWTGGKLLRLLWSFVFWGFFL